MARPKKIEHALADAVKETRRPELLGLAELAEVLGVSTRTATRWTDGEDFPKPVARLKSGPIWERPDVERWLRRRKPNGRRRG